MLFIQSTASVSENAKHTLLTASCAGDVHIVCVGDGAYANKSLMSFANNLHVYVVAEDANARGVGTVKEASQITAAEYASLIKRYNHGIALV